MRYVCTHQSSFLPYIGFWNKVLLSDIFVLNSASDFSTTSMYYRTYMPKKTMGELEYWTVAMDRKNIAPDARIGEVPLRPEAMSNLKNQFQGYLAFYKKHGAVNVNAVRNYLMPIFEMELTTLDAVNFQLFLAVKTWLDARAELVLNVEKEFSEVDDKSKRLAHQLEYHCGNEPDTVYLSGSSGRKYLDEQSFKEVFDAKIVYQTEAYGDFYHGSILHHMLLIARQDLPQFIKEQFLWQEK